MRIPLKMRFYDPDGKVLTQNNLPLAADESNAITLRDVCIVALTTEFQEDQNPSNILDEKLKRFAAYQEFMVTDKHQFEMEIKPEVAAYVKPRIARCFSILICGPACSILDTGIAPALKE